MPQIIFDSSARLKQNKVVLPNFGEVYKSIFVQRASDESVT